MFKTVRDDEDMKLETVILLLLCCCTATGGKLPQLRHKHNESGQMGPQVGSQVGLQAVATAPDQANGFLNRLRRPRRNIWDHSRPDVQQWILQFMNMGYDEARLEADLSFWRDQWRSSDQGRQHHYDESAAIRLQDASSYRHGANVNYDYY